MQLKVFPPHQLGALVRVRALVLVLMLASMLTTTTGRAELPARALLRALAESGSEHPLLPRGSDGRLGVLIESDRVPGAATPVAPGVYYLRDTRAGLSDLLTRHPEARAVWAPPLRPLLDRVDEWTRASAYRNQTGLSGEGVLVGIVDTGFDVQHRDLRNADGTTRVRWWIDFSSDPAGRHPALEDQYGCTSQNFSCRILNHQDIDELLFNDVTGDEPRDRRGHGTHVASLAAGNGLSGDSPLYLGSAPAAMLAFAQVSGPAGGIEEASVLAGTQFIYDRARELGAPAVVNVSLGTDFGAHDGSSLLERALAAFVGPSRPGRALVVAAGNSAAQLQGLTDDYPEPLGIHTEVHVPRGTTVQVPLLTSSADASLPGGVFAWLQSRPGDRLRVGFSDGSGRETRWVEHGDSGSFVIQDEDLDILVTLVNSPASVDEALGVGPSSAALTISGTWDAGRTFVVELEGQGTALIWVEGTGALGGAFGGGVFLPRSSKQGTITIPASHPELIAVGATLNRKTWPTRSGSPFVPAALDEPLDSVAYFSSAGPNSRGWMKPDLVAPGAHVVGAMSRDADPRLSGGGLFSGAACRDPGCFVADETHAVSTGTSMAAPIVSGAAALLLQRDPGLSSEQVRRLLMAGTRNVEGQIAEAPQAGAGALDLLGSLQALDLLASERLGGASPDPERSRLVLASSFLHPDPSWPLSGYLLLRDASGAVTDVARQRLRFEAPGAASLTFAPSVPGLWSFSVAARSDAGGRRQRLRVLIDEAPLLERELPVAVDRAVAHGGFSARGGCSVAGRSSAGALWLWWLASWLPVGWRRLGQARRA